MMIADHEVESFDYPEWLSQETKRIADVFLSSVKKHINHYELEINSGKLGSAREFFIAEQDKLQAQYDALLSLCFDNAMRSIWMEIDNNSKVRGSELLIAVVNAYSFWDLRPEHSLSKKKKIAEDIVDCVGKLVDLLNTDSAIKYSVNRLFDQTAKGVSQNHTLKISVHAPYIGGRYKKHEKEKMHSQLKEPSYKYWGGMIDVAAVLREVASDMSFALKEGVYDGKKAPKSTKLTLYPRKLNAQSAERTYFIRVVAEAIYSIFGEKRYRMVADIMQVLRPYDCDGITEDDIRKNLA